MRADDPAGAPVSPADDAEAFRRLYDAHAGRVYALALRLLVDRAEAEEATQDAFVRVWERLASFRGESALGTWIHRLALRVVLGRQRTAGRRDARVRLSSDFAPPAARARDVAETLDVLASARPEPVDERLDLDTALARLPAALRTAFVLREVEGYAYAEIAALTRSSEVAVRSQVSRARRALAAFLDGDRP